MLVRSFIPVAAAAALALLAPERSRAAPLAPAATVPRASAAAVNEPAANVLVLRDGARTIEAWRAGPFTTDARGRFLAPVRLAYPNRREPVSALVDRSAIVQLARAPLARAASPDAAEAHRTLARLGARPLRPLMASIGLWLVEGKADEDGLSLAARLARPESRQAGIVQAFPNLYLERRAYTDPFVPNDPRFPGQWYFERLRMTEAWGIERGDPSTSIVIVDTGCDLDHPDLRAKLDPGRDVADQDDDPSAHPGEPGASHGTACAGIAGAETDNAEGIAGGCPNCRLRCVRLLTGEPLPLSAEVEAFQFALEVDAAVVSNSWGYVQALPAPNVVRNAIDHLFETGRGGKGALVVFAAGNDDRELGDDELTGVRGVLNVGAINNFDEQTPFTNYGASLDLVAYTGTLTTDLSGPAGSDPGDYMSNFGGTSSACPVVAGIAGLLASTGTEHTSAELYEILLRTARAAPYAMPDESGHDPVFGFGIVDPVAALGEVLGLPEPEDPPDAGAPGPGAGNGDAEASSGCATRSSRSAPSWSMAGWLALLAALSRRRSVRPARAGG